MEAQEDMSVDPSSRPVPPPPEKVPGGGPTHTGDTPPRQIDR